MLIETEKTPNPATLKFLPGRQVMTAGTRDFATSDEAEASPLAEAIFSLGDVTGVFFGSDFVSVTIAPGAQWSDVKPDVLSILLDHFAAAMPLFHAGSAAGITVPADDDYFAEDPADAEIVEQTTAWPPERRDVPDIDSDLMVRLSDHAPVVTSIRF